MFFAHRTKQRILVAIAVCAIYLVLVAAAAVLFPYLGTGFASSFGWWLIAVPLGLVAYIALELFGTWSLGFPFWQRMPNWARVLLLVSIISFGVVGIAILSQFFGGNSAL
jgi:hypothetical protein